MVLPRPFGGALVAIALLGLASSSCRSGTLIHLPIHPPQERAGGSHEPRGMLHAVVESPGGELHVVNTHLDASREDGYRWQEIGHLLSRVDSLRARGLSSTASDHRAVLVRLVRPEAPGAAPSTQPAPGTDIWLFPLAPMGAAVAVDEGVRVTRRPGYDNQPGFLPGSEALLYTAIDETEQADIWRYDLPSRRTSPVTRTAPESEYSATVLPSGDRFSVIRVESDSTQRLWSFDLSGGDPRVILPEVRPVGYHAWLDADRLALFVLGDPPTLQLASVPEGSVREVARDIGRCLQRIPGPGTLSFVQRAESGTGWIAEYDPRTRAVRALAPLLEGNEFFAWTPESVLVMGRGSTLFRWVLGLSEEWTEVADLSPAGVGAISRIAISPDGRWIAVVGEEAG